MSTTVAGEDRRTRRDRRGQAGQRRPVSKAKVLVGRVLLLAAVLCLWQFLPQIPALHATGPLFDPFFVSSPSRVAQRLGDLMGFTGDAVTMWPNLGNTVVATLVGVALGTLLGFVLGLVLSESVLAQRILAPFLSFFNAMPRIALVPIFVILVGASLKMEIVTCITVVFFLVFYNALSGGASVPPDVIANAELLGATRGQLMLRVRARYVFVWTVASLPNAISFGVVSAVTAELLAGQLGMGTMLQTSITTVDSTLTFSVVVVLAVVGVILVGAAQLVSRSALRWWEAN